MHVYIYIYIVFDIWVQTCGNLDAKNKMWDISEGTYLVVWNSENGKAYGITTS